MGEEEEVTETWQQKLLFYTTAFFVLLGTFSLFSFLFLVPFVIDPAFTTIFMEFDETPALCVTVRTSKLLGATNCTWSSCREGCTRDIYECLQIFVNYKRNLSDYNMTADSLTELVMPDDVTVSRRRRRRKRTLMISSDYQDMSYPEEEDLIDEYEEIEQTTGLMGNDSEWYYKEARLLPNVKGCGYPPMLNCSVFLKTYKDVGTNFSCFYSRVDPGMVISHLDMWQVYMNLVYAMAIPIPSFILSVIYLAIAYFKIYNEDEEKAPLEMNAEAMDGVEGDMEDLEDGVMATAGTLPASGGITPASEAFREDLASFGHHFKVAMVDDMSRDSFNTDANSVTLGGNMCKTMTTSVSSTTGGPIADI